MRAAFAGPQIVCSEGNGVKRLDARLIRINGSIDGLGPEDALATVLASVGWNYSLSNGVVAISGDNTVPGQ